MKRRNDRCSYVYIEVACGSTFFDVKFYSCRPYVGLEFIYLFIVCLSDARRQSLSAR